MKAPLWLDERDALTLHDRLLGLHGGAPGLRSEALLQSALARRHQHYAYGAVPDIVQLAAIYTSGILQNHPFVDGNKRTGFVLGVLFLELNGYRFHATEEAAAHAVIALASGRIDEPGYCEFLREHSTQRRS
jgi:death on curing protein